MARSGTPHPGTWTLLFCSPTLPRSNIVDKQKSRPGTYSEPSGQQHAYKRLNTGQFPLVTPSSDTLSEQLASVYCHKCWIPPTHEQMWGQWKISRKHTRMSLLIFCHLNTTKHHEKKNTQNTYWYNLYILQVEPPQWPYSWEILHVQNDIRRIRITSKDTYRYCSVSHTLNILINLFIILDEHTIVIVRFSFCSAQQHDS